MGMKPIKVRSTIEVLFTSRSQSCTYAAVYVHDSVDYTNGGRFHPLHMRVIKFHAFNVLDKLNFKRIVGAIFFLISSYFFPLGKSLQIG